ncbi:MAG: cystathionine gamma-synthase [Myxococcota bacterium]
MTFPRQHNLHTPNDQGDRNTLCVRSGLLTDHQHGAVVPPLHLSSNFTFKAFGQKREYDYTRSGNPTRDLLAQAIAEQECGVGGVVTASGMAAVGLVSQLLSPGERIVAAHDSYGGTHRLFSALAERGSFEVSFVDLTASTAAAEVSRLNPKLVWAETPSNPLLRITDIEAIAQAVHGVGGLLVVDNTFLSPALQRPLTLGADIVVHSTTKYINGHGDVVGGAVVARDRAVLENLAWWANAFGVSGAPFDSYLTLRGLRTLPARLRVHQENAEAVVSALLQGDVAAVHYPGLSGHPHHEVAARQQNGFGAMVSFELAGGREAAEVFVQALQIFSLAESLGGVESLVAHPATMTHADMDAEARRSAGISDGLLRLSVGIEHVDDLRRDICRGLEAVEKQVTARRRAQRAAPVETSTVDAVYSC